jgi:(R,R)-butanediol dehydrogenase/meso-butanediol dehydrogenase/diacetyl reductase
MVHPLPEDVDLSLAALIEPLAVAWHAVKTSALTSWADKSALVVGGGPVGIACILVLRAFGCKLVVVSEPAVVRAKQNKGIADAVLNPLEDDVGARCRELTAGEGVDVVFDCAGNQKGFEAGMDALRYRGTYMNVAVWFGSPVSAEIQRVNHLVLNCADANSVLPVHAEGDYGQVLPSVR